MLFDLFSKKKKVEPAPERPQGVSTVYVGEFPQHSNFRGFKRIYLTTYGNDRALKGIDMLIKANASKEPFDVKGRTIKLQLVKDTVTFTEDAYYLNVYVDGMMVGTGYRCDYISEIMAGMVDKVYVKIDSGDDRFNSYLFIHIKSNEEV